MSSVFHDIILKKNDTGQWRGESVKPRKENYGDRNLIGKNVERIRKEQGYKQKDFIARLQTQGLDINPTSYSKLEGQFRNATDKEVYAIAQALHVPIEELFKEN